MFHLVMSMAAALGPSLISRFGPVAKGYQWDAKSVRIFPLLSLVSVAAHCAMSPLLPQLQDSLCHRLLLRGKLLLPQIKSEQDHDVFTSLE